MPLPPDPSDAVLAYTLAHLSSRRTVRAAMALGALPRVGLKGARELWRSPVLLDAPPRIALRLRYPELRVGHVGDGWAAQRAAPMVGLQSESWRNRLVTERPEVVLLDAAPPWLGPNEVTEVVHAAHRIGAHVVAVGGGLRAVRRAGMDRHLDVAVTDEVTGARSRLALGPWVDHRVTNPIGLPVAPQGVVPLDMDVPPTVAASAVQHAAVATAPLATTAPGRHAAQVVHALAAGVPTVATRTATLAAALHGVDDLLVARDDEVAPLAAALAADRRERERWSVRLRRHVLATRDAVSRFEELLALLDLPRRPPPVVSVLLATRREQRLSAAIESVAVQDHPRVELQLTLHGIDPPVPEGALDRLPLPARVHRIGADQPLGYALNVALDAASGEYVAKMDDDDLYGPGHLSDLLVAARYTGAEAVGRWANVVHLEAQQRTVEQHVARQEIWAHHLPGATLLVDGPTMRQLRWRRVPRGVDSELIRAIHGLGGRCYATHRFGFVRRRHGDHTFDRRDTAYTREGDQLTGLDLSALYV
jgi:hypothetical protein